MIIHISRLINPGTPSEPGCTGTDDPSLWLHRIRIHGHIYQAYLKSDIINSVPDYLPLYQHFLLHPEFWLRLQDPTTPNLPT